MVESLQVVILAAGMGTRLGMSHPKALTVLKDGRTILAQQLQNIRSAFGSEVEIIVVVGFKKSQIMEAAPTVLYSYNDNFDRTNTAKSLLRALEATGEGPTLWLNGDVVFHPAILERSRSLIQEGISFVAVNTENVGEEEVKYTTDGFGNIKALSKRISVETALGEAVGINFISSDFKPVLIEKLRIVNDDDYFERGLELAIEDENLVVKPLDISDVFAIEIDFIDDLTSANARL